LTAATSAAEPAIARYDLTDEEKRLLCFVSDKEDFTSVESRQAVMQTVMNRTADERFPDNIADVLYAPKQFQVMKMYSEDYAPSDEALEALDRILYGEDIFGGANVLFFAADYVEPHRIAKGLYAVLEVGGTIFYRQEAVN
jgi:spore germination cell wall hydrolase CwlJ-like protein